ncbi:hypothetical protein OH77DRAFT_182731 [Trametes cingulata]|nr:hypothetical protein OH77DRAFT_182731 [Trametes cingulata]
MILCQSQKHTQTARATPSPHPRQPYLSHAGAAAGKSALGHQPLRDCYSGFHIDRPPRFCSVHESVEQNTQVWKVQPPRTTAPQRLPPPGLDLAHCSSNPLGLILPRTRRYAPIVEKRVDFAEEPLQKATVEVVFSPRRHCGGPRTQEELCVAVAGMP